MKITASLLTHYKKSITISWKASPWMFLLRLLLEIVAVIIPTASLYLSRTAINLLSTGVSTTVRKDFYFVILFITIVHILGNSNTKLNTYISTVHSDLVMNVIDLEIADKINELDISFFDNSAFYDQIQNSMRDSRSLHSLTWLSISLVRSIVQIAVNTVILTGLSWGLPIVIVVFSLPSIFLDKYIAKRKYSWQLKRARNDRKLAYTKGLLTGKAYSKDVRLLNIASFFRQKFMDMWQVWFREKKKLDRQRLMLSFSGSLLPQIISTSVLLIIGNGIFAGEYTLGDYSLYGGIVTQLFASVGMLASVINQSYESRLRLDNFNAFLQTEPRITDTGTKTLREVNSIQFINVSFTYPGAKSKALEDVSFFVSKKQSVAIVGMNGAGKSTIIKLILRLYDPDSGQILINGIDIKEYKMADYYRCVGVVFQDFCRYNLRLREAIALADTKKMDDDTRIINACRNAGLDMGKFSKRGIDTYLGRIFDDEGIELSGGDWQKVAIAQAYFRESSLIVFDEPNASLDPIAERNLFEKMADLGREKCVIYVTHRLLSTKLADKIIVIDRGRCIEEGQHADLMEQRGKYRELFEKQVSNYLD